jgi:hypothetical protein
MTPSRPVTPQPDRRQPKTPSHKTFSQRPVMNLLITGRPLFLVAATKNKCVKLHSKNVQDRCVGGALNSL